MSKKKTEVPEEWQPKPALTPEAKENQLIALAIREAEYQLEHHTASSQVISHYLKLGSTRERLEKEILEKQRELITAKTDAIRNDQISKELFSEAIEAMARYSGEKTKDIAD